MIDTSFSRSQFSRFLAAGTARRDAATWKFSRMPTVVREAEEAELELLEAEAATTAQESEQPTGGAFVSRRGAAAYESGADTSGETRKYVLPRRRSGTVNKKIWINLQQRAP